MTTTSRERREAVQRSMVKAHGLFWDGEHANFDEDWSDPVIRAEMEELADAALAAALPDDIVFVRRDDLRRALSIVERHTNEGTSPLTDRLLSAIGEEG